VISDSQRLALAGIYLLKKLDVDAEHGGLELPIVTPPELEALDPALEHLALDGMIAVDRKKGHWVLTQVGIEHIGTLIDEAEHYIEEFDNAPAETIVAELQRRNLDPLRVRFLWGWYQGELDDLALWQQRRGVTEIETEWASYLMSDAFWAELGRDLASHGSD
jgi:hypothetical protein